MRLFHRCANCLRIRLCEAEPGAEHILCDECKATDREPQPA